MAVKAPLRPVLKRISRELVDYARAQGLNRSEFALVGSWNERTGRISLVVGTTQPIDGMRWYSEILAKLRESFGEAGQPWATWNIGLVIQWVRDLDQVYLDFKVGDDEDDVTGLLESSAEAAWDASQSSPASASEPDHEG